MFITLTQANKLNVGDVFTSWKSLCEASGIKYSKDTRVQKSQRLELSRFFDFEKIGRKYYILSKYDIPLLKPYTGKSIYREILQLLILDYIAKNHNTTHGIGLSIAQDQLFLTLAFVNRDFHKCRNGSERDFLSNELDIKLNVIDSFYNRHTSRIAGIIQGALNSLSNQSFIAWHLHKYFVFKDGTRMLVGDNSIEENRLIDIEREILEFMGYGEEDVSELEEDKKTGKQKLYLDGKYLEFMNNVVNEYNALYDENIKYMYNSYDITYNSNFDVIQRKKMVIQYDLQGKLIGKQSELNTLVVEEIINNASARLSNPYYLGNELILTDRLIKRD